MSGLCFISKLVERVVASQLNDYVCSNGLENVKQSAYKLGHSTDADDTQLYVHLTHKNVSHAFDRLERCLEDVKKWLSANKLKLNPDKTEFIVFGSKIHTEKLNKSIPANILGNFLSPVGEVRNLGVWFDSDFSFSRHVQNICKHFGLSFAYDAPKIWNDLPDDVRSATSLHSFRRKLKAYLFAQAYPP